MSPKEIRRYRSELRLKWKAWALESSIKERVQSRCAFCALYTLTWHFCHANGAEGAGWCFYVCDACVPPDLLVALSLVVLSHDG